MKGIVKKVVSLSLVFGVLLSAFSVCFPCFLDMNSAKAVSNEKICITNIQCIDYGWYEGNEGDSCLFNLDKKGLCNNANENLYYRNGNIGLDGTEFNNGFEAWIARWNYQDEISFAYASFALDGKYTSLSCKTDLIQSYNISNFDTTLYFYNGNDYITSVVMTDENYRHSFNVNVSDVDTLTIVVKDNVAVSGGTSFALYDMFLSQDTPSVDTSTTYTVEVYEMMSDGWYPENPSYVQVFTGESDTVVFVAPEMYIKDGFDVNRDISVLEAVVSRDGTTVLKVYLERSDYLKHKISYMYVGDVPAEAPVLPAVSYAIPGAEVTTAATPVVEGYTFTGWYMNGVIYDNSFIMPESDVVLEGVWIKNNDSIKLIARNGSTTVIDRNNKTVDDYDDGCEWYIYGLEERLRDDKLIQEYIDVQGDGIIEITYSLEEIAPYVGTGSTISVFDNVTDLLVEKFTMIIFGDINGDSCVMANDVDLVKKEVNGETSWSIEGSVEYDLAKTIAADVNRDGKVDAEDWQLIEQHALGIIEIDQTTSPINSFNSDSEIQELESGLSVFTNNTSLLYMSGDFALFAVSQIENNNFKYPKKLAVAVSNNSVIELNSIYSFDDLTKINMPILKPVINSVPEKFKNCSFVALKTKNEGTSNITFTNSDTGDTVNLLVSVFKDKYASFRAENVPIKNDRGENYNYFINGMVVSDFFCQKTNGGYFFNFDVYNQRYSLGTVEAFDSTGKLITVEKINKFKSTGTNLVTVFESGWYLIKDTFITGDLMTFKGHQVSTHTPINIFVPDGGFIRISNDAAVSTSCFLVNLFDAILTSGGIIGDTESLSKNQIDLVTKTAIAKFVGNTFYLETAKKFQENMKDMVAENVAESTLISLASQAAGIANGLLMEIGLNIEDLCKEALGSAVAGIGQKIFTTLSGAAGLSLKILFSSQKCLNYVSQMRDWYVTTNKQGFVGIITPYESDYDGGKISSPDGISVDTNEGVESEVILQTFRVLKDDVTINLNTQEILNDYVLYNIALIKDGKVIQPTKSVTVYIPVPLGFKEPISVLRQNDDGSWEHMNVEVKNNTISFDVNHFCLFAIVSEFIGLEIQKPSQNTISYGDSIILHVDLSEALPRGWYIEWTVNNDNFARAESDDGKTFTISPNKSGDTVITVTLYDENGYVISSDEQVITSKAGFFQKIIAFFKSLFGLTQVIPQVYKF